MQLYELITPTASKIIAILPGRFSPFHLGHKSGYDFLVKRFGAGAVFIATSNKVSPPKSPFSFQDKALFITATGVPRDAVVQVSNPYGAEEITHNYNPENTILVFGVGAKDMLTNPRFNFAVKKDGSASYFQPMPIDIKQCEPFARHGYILNIPTSTFRILGKHIQSASEFRDIFATASRTLKKQMVVDMFGQYNDRVLSTLENRLLGQPQ